MPTYRPPEVVREHATSLWLDLMDADGDPARVTALLDGAMQDGPELFVRTIGFATTMFFCQTWPTVLDLLGKSGVSRDAVADALTEHMGQSIGDYLRTPVTAEEATNGC